MLQDASWGVALAARAKAPRPPLAGCVQAGATCRAQWPREPRPKGDLMCDRDTLEDTIEYQLRCGLSRRHFGALTLGAGLTSWLAPVAHGDELAVTESEVDIHTPDGTADAYFVHPAKGAHAAVLVWPDLYGLRPAFRQMGKRLAGSGYSVLVVNPFYRKQRAPTAPQHADFDDPATRAALMDLMSSLSPAGTHTDAVAFVQWLDGQAAFDRRKRMATTGYCMGGPLTMRTAAAVPERVGA